MPFEGPDGQEFRDFQHCVTTIMGSDTTRKEAQEICGKWQSESKDD